MIPAAPGNCHHKGIVSNLFVLSAPGRHIGTGVGPADADKPPVRGLPAVAAASHPVVIVAQGHHAHAVFLCQITGPVHGPPRVQRAESPVPVPSLDCPHAHLTGRRGIWGDLSFFKVGYDPGETV